MNVIKGKACLVLLSFLLLHSCSSNLKLKKVEVLLRETNSSKAIPDATVEVRSQSGKKIGATFKTNPMGYVSFKVKNLPGFSVDQLENRAYQLVFSKEFDNGEKVTQISPLIKYLPFYDLYLDSTNAPSGQLKSLPSDQLVGDMHYHVSMQTHNRFGYELYDIDSPEVEVPYNLNWLKNFRKLKIWYQGMKRKPYLGEIRFDLIDSSPKWRKRYEKMKALIDHDWIIPKKGSIKFTEFTQATHPHIKEGKVYLAFNAFSPFEHNVANRNSKRIANNLFVTGAKFDWLKKIGDTDKMTHWENFNREYKNITSQDSAHNSFGWRFFRQGMNLNDNKPTIVNVLEGAHVFQDKLFPHTINYDIGSRNDREDHSLFNHLLGNGILQNGTFTRNYFESAIKTLADQSTPRTKEIINGLLANEATSIRRRGAWEQLDTLVRSAISAYSDSLLLKELGDNIDSLRRLTGPPVSMVTIAHLTYNGMMSHAPNLDGGNPFTNLVARKNFNIRVSDDPTYQKQFSSVFFNIPGVNKFGKRVIEKLVNPESGHKILIDLKHSDIFTREFFYDHYMRAPVDCLTCETGSTDSVDCRKLITPPICSHCAVTGLSKEYFSPLANEYSVLQSSSTTIFNPFGINLYDEEIELICKNEGIIGITLEQRVLGGYINKKEKRSYKITPTGKIKQNRTAYFQKRHKHNCRWLRHYFVADSSALKPALEYTEQFMGVPKINAPQSRWHRGYNRILNVTIKDYLSVEPFLQNLFYLVDHSGKSPEAAFDHLCIGSDLDGLIDPIDVVPTAGRYPHFKKRLKQFIPMFLEIRTFIGKLNKENPRTYEDYFSDNFTIDQALDKLFYVSLRNFVNKNFK